MTETFACSGLEIEPRRLKYIADHQYVNGVNYMVQHLMNYSIQGQGITDNPPDFSPHTPWWEDIDIFNDYFAKLGYILRNTKETVNTLIIHPMQSAYLNYVHNNSVNTIEELDEEFTRLTNYLAFNGVSFHYGDESILAREGKIVGDKFYVGECVYDYVIIPYTQTISNSTYELLSDFEKQGGKLCLYKEFPKYIFGKESSLPSLKGNCSFDEIIQEQDCRVKCIRGNKVLSRYCKGEIGEYLYVVNSDEDNSAEFTFDEIENFVEYDITVEETYSIGKTIVLSPCQAIILKRAATKNSRVSFGKQKDITSAFAFSTRTENTLMLDFIRFSKDGENYSDEIFYSQMLDELIFENYAGELYVRYYFTAETEGEFTLLTGNTRVKGLTFDGKELQLSQSHYDIMYSEAPLGNVKTGRHCVEFLFDYYQSDGVHHAVFDESVTESIRNCLVYDTTIEPIFIKGDFSVFKEGIISKSTLVCGLNDLQEKGLKFFSGKVWFIGAIDLQQTECKLRLVGRYMSARVFVNGAFAGTAVLGEEVDISKFTVCGSNRIEISLSSSLRNTYGPFHVKNIGEYYGVSPRWFTFRGCWQGNNALLFGEYTYAEDYEFVPFGLEKIIQISN